MKITTAFGLNDIAMSGKGAAVTTDLSAIIPTVNRLELGMESTLSANLNGHVKRFQFYKRKRLPNSTLQRISQ